MVFYNCILNIDRKCEEQYQAPDEKPAIGLILWSEYTLGLREIC